jgi:general secretion pathway protein A
MYDKYFGFSDLPFRVTPEPGFFYSNAVYQEALATLRYGIEARKGFIVVTGEVGTGKTTLLKILMQRAESTIHTAFIFNPKLNFAGLFRFILNDLGMPCSTDDKALLLEQLNDYLIQQLKNGHIVAVLLDEAQDLSDDSLEELRLLSNFETDKEKLIQIVLMGQPELEQRLNRPELRQLKQRIALRCRLAPLKGYEIREYIDFRLKTVGYAGKELFDRDAVEKITFYSTGIPRLINVICDNALLNAYATGKRTISAKAIEEVASDLQLKLPPQVATQATNLDRPQNRDNARTDSQKPPAFGRKQRGAPISRTLVAQTAGILLFLLALAGGSVALYYQPSKENLADIKENLSDIIVTAQNRYQPSKNYLSHVAGEAREFLDTQWETLKHANPIPKIAKKVADNPNATPQGQVAANKTGRSAPGKAQDLQAANAGHRNDVQGAPAQGRSTQDSGDDIVAPAMRNKPAEPRGTKSSPTQVEQAAATEPAIHKPDRPRAQRPEPQKYSLNEKTTELGSLKGAKNNPRSFRGHFEVVKNSVVFEKPTTEGAIVATLPPRTWVRVEERVGNYLRVLSLNDPWIRGYVRAEDASLEYIGFVQSER